MDGAENIGEWAEHYTGIAVVGWLSLLLGVGKVLANFLSGSGVLAAVPPAALAGLLGCLAYHCVPKVFGEPVQRSMGAGFSELVVNMINFTFTALVLGFASSWRAVPHPRALVASIWHEAAPLLVYSQMLIWGQSCCALAVAGLFRAGNPAISHFLGALVCLGLETGRDVPSVTNAKVAGPWAQEVVRLADSVGLTVSILVGLLLITIHGRGKTGSLWSGRRASGGGSSGGYSLVPGYGDSAASDAADTVSDPGGGGGGDGGGGVGGGGRGSLADHLHTEHFERGRGRGGGGSSIKRPAAETSAAGAPGIRKGGGGGAMTKSRSLSPQSWSETPPTPFQPTFQIGGGDGGGRGGRGSRAWLPRSSSLLPEDTGCDRGWTSIGGAGAGGDGDASDSGSVAGLGAHFSLLAVAVFLAWVLDLSVRKLEEATPYTSRHHVISGFRLFKLSMCIALALMVAVRRFTSFRYRSEWFFRVSGLSLDLLATAAISGITFVSLEEQYSVAFIATVLACLAWNAIFFSIAAQRMFPNFWFLRAVTCIGDALGHSWVGLLLVRAMDPRLETPVPLAMAYKMMIFFVPASGGKNAIIIAMVETLGLWEAVALCAAVVTFWLYIFEVHIKQRMPQHQRHAAGTADGAAKRGKGGSGAGAGDDDDDDGAESGVELLRTGSNTASVGGAAGMTATAAAAAAGSGIERNDGVGPASPTVPRLELEEPSRILTDAQLRRLAAVLPPLLSLHTWSLVYSMMRDGASLASLLHGAADPDHAGLIIVIEDSYSYCFGGFIPHPLQGNAHNYYGTGESFVFSFHPSFAAYRWTGENPFFVLSNEACLAMGGGGGGFAFQMDDELDTGVSNASATFGNPRLSSAEYFKVLQVEVWAANSCRYAL